MNPLEVAKIQGRNKKHQKNITLFRHPLTWYCRSKRKQSDSLFPKKTDFAASFATKPTETFLDHHQKRLLHVRILKPLLINIQPMCSSTCQKKGLPYTKDKEQRISQASKFVRKHFGTCWPQAREFTLLISIYLILLLDVRWFEGI